MMRLLQNATVIISLGFLALGIFKLWMFGFSDRGVSEFCASGVCAFAVPLTVYVFQLSARIAALEKQSSAQR